MTERQLPVYQISIDDYDEAGIDLISFVSNPAILVKGVTLADNKPILQFKLSEEQMIVAGAVLIPDLKIYRYDEEIGEYYVTFSKETIKKMVERFNQNPKKDMFNIEHTEKIAPAFMLGSWIIESEEYDKSKMYGFDNLPVGTFFAEVKITDKDFWEKEIKKEGRYGFSIEGLLGLKMSELLKKNFELNRISFDVDGVLTTKEGRDMLQEEINKGSEVYIISARHTKENIFEITDEFKVPHSNIFAEGSNNAKIEKIKELNISKHYDDNQDVIDELGNIGYKFYINIISEEEFESYTDYPEAATENAQRALNYAEENGWGSCGTPVGKIRANQLANKEPISVETIKRMAAFIRHEQNKDTPYGEGCGKLMWDSWGGDEGINWAINKIQQIENEQLNQQDKIKLNKMKKRIKFSEYLTNDGVKISIEGEIMVGSPVFVILEDGTMEQMSEGEVILEDGTMLMIDAEGLISEITPAEVVVEELEQSKDKKEEVKMQVTAEEIMPIINPILDEIRAMMAEMQSRIEMLEGNKPSGELEIELNKEKFNDIKFRVSNLRRLITE